MTPREIVTDEPDVRICRLCGEPEYGPHHITCPAYVSELGLGFGGHYSGLD